VVVWQASRHDHRVPEADVAGDRQYLRDGPAQGEDVRALQRALAAAGFLVEADAVFGASTDAAVRAYQAKTGLTSDGMVGPATRARRGLG
jgi:peptidoglycan hydrolase-like protein with peptidoglycan-binding domain